MKQIYGIVFLILVLLLAVGCRKQPKISSQPEPVQSAAESQQEVQTELPASAARTWQDIQALLLMFQPCPTFRLLKKHGARSRSSCVAKAQNTGSISLKAGSRQ